ncbi:serine/threonine-protein kinase/endoribonuclease ire-1-like isoform X1 [Puntigrus tetrazona]|uniref:serine/threonine-protein kinase/endoribonuclease ire-1-like isoform X1 n=1 Tax=Puntigrus tetrazona TaxID=1606681 RepID=UPI001C8987F0|nr:serine/threonine-protein kinase/endoribonuclease ire-1-like isoform X1 [Puntigrus tetrazona]XP_043084569.1 serine/threonine-protein kinase/endoribonuclease ire-1-like isoform X1 [Puntigrus tetrazona]XP_043084578.1 serine/threonine-protein kinase/endoribonuclease ire-1-like isoform X1 [Puntigrus tetrazona]XP_043084586.1 serine/threonine-protein kinase/endoribonuclease ire-1-like isoform X1 [Puntigrus tetrazona]
MAAVEERTLKKMLKQYRHRDLAVREITDTILNYKDLRPVMDAYNFLDGSSRDLMSLAGTVPVCYRGSVYNIPVCLWLLDTYPYNPPICFVKPTSKMIIKTSRHVDSNGKIYLPYLHEWTFPRSGLCGFIQVMTGVFAEEMPVFSTSATHRPSLLARPPIRVKQGFPGISMQTEETLETESGSQNTETPEMQDIQQMTEDMRISWRNESSTRHSTKIKELLREPNIKIVDSLYFFKDEKYMIGFGGGSTQVYIGMRKDGIEVAIKLITKNPRNNKDFENELKLLQDLKLESKNIVRYMTFAEDKDFYYLANQLCEYDLVGYMDYLRQPEQKDRKETTLRRIVKEMLLGLQVLHRAGVVHRDIKPRNVLIDKEERARLADFGISRKLEEGKTTVYTDRAGTQGWEATEILEQFEQGSTELKTHYKRSSDIQVAGMLTYYILSDGKHPFGNGISREANILEGKRVCDDVKDGTATDLVDWMINKNQSERPNVDDVLNHPHFWDDKRIREVLHYLGNKEEVQEYKNYGCKEKLFETVQKYSEGKTFSDWKTKAPKTWTKIGKNLPNDLLGLLRHLRNALGHREKEFYEEKMIDEFPDFLISLHRLALEMGWEY